MIGSSIRFGRSNPEVQTQFVIWITNEAPPQTDEMYIGWMSDIR
jgi:hypothetical protein